MNGTDLTSLVGLSMLILAGGLVGSFGVSALLRSGMGRRFVRTWRWWGLALYYTSVAGVLVAALGWILRSLLGATAVNGVLGSPWLFVTFGVVIGLPFTLAPITTVWREYHGPEKQQSKQQPASRQDRLDFARDLERQLREYTIESRTINIELQGDKGTVLFFRGDITREQGERLVAALRSDFQTLSIQRIEGQGDQGKWWVRV